MALVTRNALLLAKEETTEGEDSVPTAADNAILISNPERPTPEPNVIEDDAATGSLDPDEPIIGGMFMNLPVEVILKGSGAAGTAPEWGILMRACGWKETVTATPVPASGTTTATAGTTSSFDVDTSVDTDWSTTDQAYRGMPVTLSGNPATPVTTLITDYTVSGSTATVTVAHTFDSALDNTTEAKIPVNVLYGPASTNIPSVTEYFYMDGLLWKLLGARGSVSLTLNSGREWRAQFNFRAMFDSKTDVAVPTATLDDATKPIWKNGLMLTKGQEVALQQLSLGTNPDITNPDNPNAAEGFDPAIITARNLQGTFNPLEQLVANMDFMADFRAGTKRKLGAIAGSSTGNQLGLTIPEAKYRNVTPTDRENLAANDIPFSAVGRDAGAFLTVF